MMHNRPNCRLNLQAGLNEGSGNTLAAWSYLQRDMWGSGRTMSCCWLVGSSQYDSSQRQVVALPSSLSVVLSIGTSFAWYSLQKWRVFDGIPFFRAGIEVYAPCHADDRCHTIKALGSTWFSKSRPMGDLAIMSGACDNELYGWSDDMWSSDWRSDLSPDRKSRICIS